MLTDFYLVKKEGRNKGPDVKRGQYSCRISNFSFKSEAYYWVKGV